HLKGNVSDRINNTGDADIIIGGPGEDYIKGGKDNDILVGGSVDLTDDGELIESTLTRDNEADLFVFYPDDGTNTIMDYELNTDVIYLLTGNAGTFLTDYITNYTVDDDIILCFDNTKVILKGIYSQSGVILNDTLLKEYAEMQSPVPGTSLNSTTATFTWSDVGADEYRLCISSYSISG
ncbi:MAG: hypothetical protein GY749_06695, partial [Desulfobacteraceae bacterium]|nr:hypothetical protein [Desulfobacteraceae bacterium]